MSGATHKAHEGRGLMHAAGSPTVRRRELGFLLRSLRAAMGLTTEQVAERIGVSRSKISRLENGRRGTSKDDITRLCDLYQVDEEGRSRLTELATEGKQRTSWPLSQQYFDYFGLEAEAESISDYGLAIMPGLLQTPDYARAIVGVGGPTLTPTIIEERVQARIARQRLLTSRRAPRFEAVLDESVLHRVVGSPAVMLAQLRRLLELSQLPNVAIRVVPYEASVVPAGVNKFIILRFALPDISDIVFIEELTGHRYLEDPSDIETYNTTFRILRSLSADPAASMAMILAQLTAYEVRVTRQP
jgi:transcriptional regulator with XRE-family HTH domain